ncbi:HPP family protein [Myroides sp. 1354]|uniref:HPP family protein n=1 Tax=unclassified Myroides TaxID=2642485 RepID=UPI002577F8CA|nr:MULTISPECIES: HPP family protein [unclassified Myroides]MDM1044691.1 HPP family protein [Myroides sp. R163-1]MDM1055404.1 HPP family protein [Myroides sp. 1354]MDM1068701.1 HPP family protein [Myroides sp. 1372]
MSIKKNKVYRRTRYLLYKETLVDFNEHLWAFIGSFVGLATICYLHYQAFSQYDLTLLIGSFGASCVLIYGAIGSPLAQPKNLFFGHLISAVIGVSVYKLLGDYIWIAAPLAVSLSIIGMQMAKSLHPPGGATALIAVTGGSSITNLGYTYVLSPVLTGVTILFIAALLFNNIPHKRQYPVKSFILLHRIKRRKKR